MSYFAVYLRFWLILSAWQVPLPWLDYHVGTLPSVAQQQHLSLFHGDSTAATGWHWHLGCCHHPEIPFGWSFSHPPMSPECPETADEDVEVTLQSRLNFQAPELLVSKSRCAAVEVDVRIHAQANDCATGFPFWSACAVGPLLDSGRMRCILHCHWVC